MLTRTFCFQTSRYGILSCLHWILIHNWKCAIDRKPNSHSCAVRFTAVFVQGILRSLFSLTRVQKNLGTSKLSTNQTKVSIASSIAHELAALNRFHFTDGWYFWTLHDGMSKTSLLVLYQCCCLGALLTSKDVFRFILYVVWNPHVFSRNR